jgi:cytochrome P450
MATATLRNNIPAHVPSHLVLPYELMDRRTIMTNPYEELIPQVHRGPAVFFAPDILGGSGPAWIVRRARDLRSVYADDGHFMKGGIENPAVISGENGWTPIPTGLNPPRHTGFRRVLNPLFSPKRMSELQAMISQRARELIAVFRDRGECDFIEDFAVAFPVSIFLDLLGLPQSEMKQFLAWEYQLLHTRDAGDRVRGVLAVKEYLLQAIEDRRKQPRGDLISDALDLEIDGRKWTAMEVFGYCYNLYVGGLDTVASNMGLHFHHLAIHPEQQAQLRANPELIPAAVEEFMRAYAAVTTLRHCYRDVEIDGVQIKAGDRVAMTTPLAGRDPEEYSDPQVVRFDRQPSHVSFGFGIHRCLGVHLARRELHIAIKEVLVALPPFEIRSGVRIPFFVGGVVHLETLPLTWRP